MEAGLARRGRGLSVSDYMSESSLKALERTGERKDKNKKWVINY